MSSGQSCNAPESACVTGQPPRGQAPLDVAVAVVIRPAGGMAAQSDLACEVLVGLRAPDAVLGGLSEYPGGKVEPGETPAQAAARELREEMGVGSEAFTAPVRPLCVVEPADPVAARERSVRLHAFLFEVAAGTEARALGSAAAQWIRPSQIDSLAWPRANASIHAALARALATRGS